MHKFKKPSGVILDVNANSFEYAKSLGWEEVKEPAKTPPKPKARKRGNSTDSN